MIGDRRRNYEEKYLYLILCLYVISKFTYVFFYVLELLELLKSNLLLFAVATSLDAITSRYCYPKQLI